jgi:hypothetical protein
MPTADSIADHERILLLTGYRHFVTEPTAEAAFETITRLSGAALDTDAFHQAIAQCVANGTIREPVRLEPNSLHCHWRLELTPTGVASARILSGA